MRTKIFEGRWSKEQNIKRSNALMGHSVSMKARKKMSLAKKNKPLSRAQLESIRNLIKFNTGRKRIGECLSGKDHSNWQGGKSHEIYHLGWNRTFKEQIRRRDEYKCQKCGMPEVESYGRLCVHHKDLNKQNIEPNNLISLCRSCHITLHWKLIRRRNL